MSKLGSIFQKVEAGPSGSCPLPEPGRGAPPIEQPGHLDIRRQPKGYNYDAEVQKSEAKRFQQFLKEERTKNSKVEEWARKHGEEFCR